MKKFASFLKVTTLVSLKFQILFTGILISYSQFVHAEGTRQLEPADPSANPNRRTHIVFDQTASSHRIPFASYNAQERYRLNVTIDNFLTEQIYFGFNDNAQGLFYRVLDPDGMVVSGFGSAPVPPSGDGYISNWTQAFAGPKIGPVNPGGYNPLIITPTKLGNYYFEFAPDQSGSSFQTSKEMSLFDISVVKNGEVVNGRLWSKSWQLSDGSGTDQILSWPADLFIILLNG